MRYKMLLVTFVLLTTPLWSQQISPLIVETLPPTPAVVKSGEFFQQTYRIHFLDLSARGQEIVVLEDQLSAFNVPIFPFEAINLDKAKNKVGNVHIWDFTYTLRLLNKEKGVYIIPKIRIPWIWEGGEQNHPVVETEEVPVHYISTITPGAFLNVRDRIDFGSFYRTAQRLWVVSGTLLVVLVTFWAVALFKQGRLRHQSAMLPLVIAQEADEGMPEGIRVLSFKQARRNLQHALRCWKKATAHPPVFSESEPPAPFWLKQGREVFGSLYVFLTAAGGYPIGHTPKDILNDLRLGVVQRPIRIGWQNILLFLAERLVLYQWFLENGTFYVFADQAEVKIIQKSLPGFYWYGWPRLWLRQVPTYFSWWRRLRGGVQ